MAVRLRTLPAVITGAAGQRKQITASYQDVYSLSIRSVDSNTGTQYIGDETVDSTNGMPMVNGDTVEIDTPDSMSKEGFDPTKIYVVASAANQEFRVTVFIRDRSK
jgi:hypothetical protein